MRPVGAAVHLRKGTVNMRMVGWMVLGSVPMAFLGAYLLHLIGASGAARPDERGDRARRSRCWSAPRAMVLRYVLDRRGAATQRLATITEMARSGRCRRS